MNKGLNKGQGEPLYTYHISDPVGMTSEPSDHLPTSSIHNTHCEVVSSNGKHTAAQDCIISFNITFYFINYKCVPLGCV